MAENDEENKGTPNEDGKSAPDATTDDGTKITEEQVAAEENNGDDEEPGTPQIGEGDNEGNKSGEADDNGDDGSNDDGTAGDDYTPTGNEGYDDVINVLKDNKVSREDAEKIFKEALDTNDLNKVDVEGLKKAVGESTAKLILEKLSNQVEATKQANTDHAKAIYELAGDQKSWEAAAKWATESKHFGDNARELNEMLSAGGRQAKAAVDEILGAYKNSSSFKQEADLIDGENGEGQGSDPISKREYFEQLDEENSRSGGARPSKVKAINEAYRAFKATQK